MKRIGLVGEAPGDTASITNLLSKKYKDIEFFNLIRDIRGGQLDDPKTKHIFRKEYEISKPDIVIFIRDLDGLKSDKHQIQIRKQYFTDFNSVVDKRGIYLLNIYEIEALILADISTFNVAYKTEIKAFEDVMQVIEPKEFLKKAAKGNVKYVESHNSEIFKKLNFQQVLTCQYFKDFIDEFDEILA